MEKREQVLWIAAPAERLAVAYDPQATRIRISVSVSHEVWDLCPAGSELWMMTGGGKLGRKLVLWSLEQNAALREFNCPDGAGAGVTVCDGKLWLPHRHNRKLFCMDPETGKVNWIIRTENEMFSPASHRNELWLIECDPGPLGHWDKEQQARYFFSRYDPVREQIVERRPLDFTPACMAVDGERFWYSRLGAKGFSSTEKNLGKL
jgi:hypothetical protein